MIDHKVFGNNNDLKLNTNNPGINARKPLRVEVPLYSGATLNLKNRVCVDGTVLKPSVHYKYRVSLLTRQGVLQPVLDDDTVPTIPSYTYNHLTMVITFASSGDHPDFYIPAGENIIVVLQ